MIHACRGWPGIKNGFWEAASRHYGAESSTQRAPAFQCLFPPRRHLANPSCICNMWCNIAAVLHHHHPLPTQQPPYPRTHFPLSLGRRAVPKFHSYMQSKPHWFQLVPTHGRHYASVAQYPPNPNVVWRSALSICCHCACQNHLRRDGRVLNVS
jgi:hypothetical protein